MSETNNTLFTERQTTESLQQLVKSLSKADNKRMIDDLKFIQVQHKHNYHLVDLEFQYRVGFALAVTWTRANLMAKPRRNFGTGLFIHTLYEPEKSACVMNYPSDEYAPRTVMMNPSQAPLGVSRPVRMMPSGEVLANWEQQVEARRNGYALGWRDGTDYIRAEAELPTITTKEDIISEQQATLDAERRRNEYQRESELAALKYYDECIANGIDPRPASFY